MINANKRLFRWGPIPGRPINVSYWATIFFNYPGRPHQYIWPESYLIFYKEKMLYISVMEELELVGKKVFQRVITTPKVRGVWQQWNQRATQLFLFCQQINQSYLRGLSDRELEKHWQKFNKLGYRFWEPGVLPEFGAYGGEVVLRELLAKEHLPAQKERKVFSILSAPVGLSFYQEEERDLLKVMQQYRTKSFKRLLKKHQRKYFWLENSYYETKVLENNFFQNRIQGKIKVKVRPAVVLKSMQQYLDQAKQQKSRIVADFKNKKEIKRVADSLSYCIWWQDQRKKHIFRYLHYYSVLVNEFARRSRISPRIFDFAWVNEVRLFPSRRLVELLKKRKKGYFIAHFWENNRRLYYGQQAKKIAQRFWPKQRKISAIEIAGTVVYAAKKPITGKVFVIKDVKDIKKFPNNRILVTSMTAPEYIIAIRKAKAVITDTGGLTCHAAIVSRELKVPCIVGTKIATQVFKSGDKVEVDAKQGIVKKI